MNENYKKSFFATIKIPDSIGKSFVSYKNIPWGDIKVNIFIPSEENFLHIILSSEIALRNYSDKNSLNDNVIYSLESSASPLVRVSKYYPSDEKFLLEVLKDSSFSSQNILLKTEHINTTPELFIDEVLNQFKVNINERFKSNSFTIYDQNNKKIESNLSKDFNTNLMNTYTRAFKKIKRFLDPDINYKYRDSYLPNQLVPDINLLMQKFELNRLNKDLTESLPKQENQIKKIKI